MDPERERERMSEKGYYTSTKRRHIFILSSAGLAPRLVFLIESHEELKHFNTYKRFCDEKNERKKIFFIIYKSTIRGVL